MLAVINTRWRALHKGKLNIPDHIFFNRADGLGREYFCGVGSADFFTTCQETLAQKNIDGPVNCDRNEVRRPCDGFSVALR